MRTASYRRDVHLPSAEDFLAKYRHYSVVRAGERRLFDLLMTPETLVAATVVTEVLEMPAVTAVADVVTAAYRIRGGLTPFRKQLTGAIICALMEANGYRKTDAKKAISRAGWSRGEVYERAATYRWRISY